MLLHKYVSFSPRNDSNTVAYERKQGVIKDNVNNVAYNAADVPLSDEVHGNPGFQKAESDYETPIKN